MREPALGSVLRPQPGACYILMGTMWRVGGPSFFFHSPPREQTVRRNSSVLRSGLAQAIGAPRARVPLMSLQRGAEAGSGAAFQRQQLL